MGNEDKTKRGRGRPLGSSNKITRDVRELIHIFVAKKITHIDKVFDQLSPQNQIKYLIELLGYIIPKCQATEKQQEEDSSISIYHIINEQLKQTRNS